MTPTNTVALDALMKLADAYANATFEQGLEKRMEDQAPEQKRKELAAQLRRLLAVEAGDLARERASRQEAQRQLEGCKERLARARVQLMRELREQGWTPPRAAPAPEADKRSACTYPQCDGDEPAQGEYCKRPASNARFSR